MIVSFILLSKNTVIGTRYEISNLGYFYKFIMKKIKTLSQLIPPDS